MIRANIFFLLIEMDGLIRFYTRLSPLPDEQDDLLREKFMEISGVMLIGNGISGLFQGIMGGIFFALIGINSPVLWGGVMSILAFLPIFGIGLVLLPTAAILLLNGAIGQAISTLVFYILLSFTVEYLLKPKFVGSSVKMHTLLVFISSMSCYPPYVSTRVSDPCHAVSMRSFVGLHNSYCVCF